MANTTPSFLDAELTGTPISVSLNGVAVPPNVQNLNIVASDGQLTYDSGSNTHTLTIPTSGVAASRKLFAESPLSWDGYAVVDLSADRTIRISNATDNLDGAMSKEDKAKLNSLEPNATLWPNGDNWEFPAKIQLGSNLSYLWDEMEGTLLLYWQQPPTTSHAVSGGYERVFQYSTSGTYQLTNVSSETMLTIAENVYHGEGDLLEGSACEGSALVEVEVENWIYDNGLGQLDGHPTRGTFHISWIKNFPTGGVTGSWDLVDPGTENTALHYGADWTPMALSVSGSLSGTKNGDLTISINHALSTWHIGSYWPKVKYKVTLFGGGTFAAA